MGFDVNRFVNSEDINEDLICNICKGVLEEGVWVPNCEHAFCKVCINKWLSRRHICPNDRQPLDLSLLKTIPRFMRNILDKMEIKCEFVSNGCQQTIALESLRQHISVCDFNPEKRIECLSGCGLIIKKADLQSHNCVKSLRKRVDDLVEENFRNNRTISSIRHDMKSLNNENKRINDLLNNLRNDVKRLVMDRQTTVISESSTVGHNSTQFKSTERSGRVMPNPYVLITPLQSSSENGSNDEPSSSTYVPNVSRLSNNEPVFKRRTTIRVASPTHNTRSISSSMLRIDSPPLQSSTYSDDFFDTHSRQFGPNVNLSPSHDSISQDEESTSGIPIDDTYGYITLDAEQDFNDNEETEPEDEISSFEMNEYDTGFQVTVD